METLSKATMLFFIIGCLAVVLYHDTAVMADIEHWLMETRDDTGIGPIADSFREWLDGVNADVSSDVKNKLTDELLPNGIQILERPQG